MSGWETRGRRRWRFYPEWMPWGRKLVTYYVQGGGQPVGTSLFSRSEGRF